MVVFKRFKLLLLTITSWYVCCLCATIPLDISNFVLSSFVQSTRNNNFSNRSQKSTISVVPFLPIWGIVLVCLGAAVCLSSIVISGLAYYAKARPDSWMGQMWMKLT